MSKKGLILEQMNEYQAKFDELERLCTENLKNDVEFSEWEHIAKEAAGLKLMINHCKAEYRKCM